MDLIISEKAIAGERIAEFLADDKVKQKSVSGARIFEFNWKGKEISLVPLRGHISDVEFEKKYANWRGVDVRELINPKIILYAEKEYAIIQALREIAPSADNLIVATDADREGEAIGLEAITYARQTNKKIGVQRAYFSAITHEDINKSFENLEKFDYNFAYSANARREIDLIWGAVLTRFLSIISGQIGKEFLSVGRVQTPSVDYNENIMVKYPDNSVRLVKIGNFVEDASLELENKIGVCDVFKAKAGFEALSFNPKTFKLEFKPITHTVKHKHLGNLLDIGLETGRKVKITNSHSVFVLKDGKAQVLLGEELKEGDILLAPRSFAVPQVNEIDLIQEIMQTGLAKRFFVYGAYKKRWVLLSDSGRKFLIESRIRKNFVVHKSRFASSTISSWESGVKKKADYSLLSQYLAALGTDIDFFLKEEFGALFVPYRKVIRVDKCDDNCKYDDGAFIGCSDARWRLSLKLKITAELSRLLGYCLSEGSTAPWGSCHDFGLHEDELVGDAGKCVSAVFGKAPRVKKRKTSAAVCFGGALWERVLNKIFRIGKNARIKRVPHLAFNFSKENKLELLKGYFEGDGNYSTSGQLMCSTASENLASDLVYLLSSIGVMATLETGVNRSPLPGESKSRPRTYFKVKISGKENLGRMRGAIPARHRERFDEYCSNGITRIGYCGIPIEESGLSDVWLDLPRHYAQRVSPQKVKNLVATTNKQLSLSLAQKFLTFAESDLLFLRVKKIGVCKPSTDYVFDISVKDNENFVGGHGGIVLHNTLALVVDREKERIAFQNRKYWEVIAHCEKSAKEFTAIHHEEKFWEKEKALAVFSKNPTKGIVKKVDKKVRILRKPVPFNTTEFLRAATAIGFNAGRAMDVAENLYQRGFTSYPRTDNSTYPKTINLRDILNKLAGVKALMDDVSKILALKEIVPSAGKETKDHPPIYPVTAAQKEALGADEWKIYELICRRFLATLAEDAKTENTSVLLDISGEPFIAKGQVILHYGWKEVYPYSELNETFLPKLAEGDEVKVLKLDMHEKETQPPGRYSQGSLIKLMEDFGLGTKSTRPNIIQKLYARKYISGNKSIEPSKVAFAVIDSLEKHCDIVTKPEMTAKLEKEMDEIAAGKKAQSEVVNTSGDDLKKVMDLLFTNKVSVGLELRSALRFGEMFGKCKCGGNFVLRKGKSGKRFVGCGNYPSCTITYPLPQKGFITPTPDYCPECGAPIISVKNGRFSYKMCLTMTCVTKKDWAKKTSAATAEKVSSVSPDSKPSTVQASSASAGETASKPVKVRKPHAPAKLKTTKDSKVTLVKAGSGGAGEVEK